MKRFGNIWQVFCSLDNCISAIHQGTEHKRSDRDVIAAFMYRREEIEQNPKLDGILNPAKVRAYAEGLVARIESGTWRPHKPRYERKWCKPGKWRDIYCPPLEDHVVHWMIILAIKPALMRGMYAHSCGSIPNRGTEHARKYIEDWVQNDPKTTVFVKLDIRLFFPSITLPRLMQRLRSLIKDERMLALIELVLHGAPIPVPIGYYTSPWFANLYLQPFDHFVTQQLYKERRGKRISFVRHYMRNMDDMMLFGSSKRDLQKSVRAIIAELRDQYGLTIKPTWEVKKIGWHVTDENGKRRLASGTYYADFCGYKFARDATILRDRIFLSAKRTAKLIHKRKTDFGEVRLHDSQSLVSKIGWAAHCDSRSFHDKYIKPYADMNELKEVISNAAKCGIRKQT